jgi:hypothetical protein
MNATEQVFRDSEYLKWIRENNCAVMDFGQDATPSCGACFDRYKIEAMHLKARRRFGDQWVIPACPKHHQEQHDFGLVSWCVQYFGSEERAMRLAEAFLRKWRGDFTALEEIK